MSTIAPEPQDVRASGEIRPPGTPPFAGYAQSSPVVGLPIARTKSPALAAVLSLMPGLGQVYVGYYPRGFVHIVVVSGAISILAASNGEAPYAPLLGMFMVFFWMYNIIDAARLATLYNQALAGGREPDLPDGFRMPGMGGSIVGGAILIGASFAVLLHTRWGISLDWVEEWWPVFPMLFGAYLVGKALVDRAGRQG